jgi:hypothetical protein
MVYESRFSNCPQKFPLGPNRVVLTRELVGSKSWLAGVQQIYIFSYEVKGREMTSLQRENGMRLIHMPHLSAPGGGIADVPRVTTR